jgi:hypothetical protein
VDRAPRIGDREIIEGLATLQSEQTVLQTQMTGLQQQVEGLKESLQQQVNGLQQQINDLKEFTNQRFDSLEWMFQLFISIGLALLGVAFSILGMIARVLWNQQKRLIIIETSLETQKDEISFLKHLIERFLPPQGVA